MKSLLDLISHQERIITIEDAREIFIDHPNKVHLVYPKNAMTESTVTAKSCLEACLRMKPDRIILAECRGMKRFISSVPVEMDTAVRSPLATLTVP